MAYNTIKHSDHIQVLSASFQSRIHKRYCAKIAMVNKQVDLALSPNVLKLDF